VDFDFNGNGTLDTFESILVNTVAISVFIGACLGIFAAGIKIVRFFRKASQVYDHWNGVPAHDGQPRQPGMVETQNYLVQTVGELNQKLDDQALATKKTIEEQAEATRASLEAGSKRFDTQDLLLEEVRAQVVTELNRNGGSSTKDAAHNALRVVGEMQASQEAFYAQYKIDQAASRAEWVGLFGIIRQMISLSPEEQLQLWDNATQAYIQASIAKAAETPVTPAATVTTTTVVETPSSAA